MSRQLRCPNCGSEHTLVNPGITMLVCSYCKTVVYWGEDQALKMGSQSVLPDSDTRLYMHATGKLQGRGFQVAGHLRYDHGRGGWDEWYLQLDDGGVAWISEDERDLSLELANRPDGPLPRFADLRVGAAVRLDGVPFSVRELGRATCVGGEGQLPFTILPSESYPYADIASEDGQRFATLEFDEDDRPTCFVGHVLDHEHLLIDDEKPPSAQPAHEGRHIKCSYCAGALDIPAGREVETQVCGYCGAQLELGSGEQRVLGVNPENLDPHFLFEIEQAGTFSGRRYEVCGRMLYEDDEHYRSREYLLFNPDAGYLWLAEEDNHFVLNRPTQQAPARDPFQLSTRQQVTIGPSTFRLYEQGWSNLVYVDGALPWVAKVGDRFRYADLTAAPQMFGVESDGSELEYFHGRYLTGEEVWTAFGRSDAPPRRRGVHAAQPFIRGTVAKLLMLTGGAFALVNLILALWSFTQSGTPVFQRSFTAEEYLTEAVSPPFQLPSSNIVAMKMNAPLSNSWLAVDIAFLDEKRRVVAEMDNAIEYYSGYEGGESWSEGSRNSTKYFRAPDAGRYRLILKASGGSGRGGSSRREQLSIAIYAGPVMSRYFIMAFVLAVLFPLFELLRRRSFESRRWAPVTEDDDDDD